VPAFGGLLAPYWRDDARGILVGLSQYSNKSHIVRAVLEGIAFQVRDVLEVAASDSSIHLDELRVDGGACANDLLMQLQVLLPSPSVFCMLVAFIVACGPRAYGEFSTTIDVSMIR
jgi:glycerol kinase